MNRVSLPKTFNTRSESHAYMGGSFAQESPADNPLALAQNNPSFVPNDTRIGRLLNVKIDFLNHADFSDDPSVQTDFAKQIKVTVTSKEYKNFSSNSLAGTLYDPKMGATPPSIIEGKRTQECVTCSDITGAKPRDCVGHMGKILFPDKIFNPYGNILLYELIDVLICFCVPCVKLYISPEVLIEKGIMSVKPENRVKVIAKWSEPENVTCKCGSGKCKKRKYSKKDSYKEGLIVYKENDRPGKQTAAQVYNMLAALPRSIIELLGFTDVSSFDKYTLVGVVVPEIKIRLPNRTKNGVEPHPFTEKLSVIVALSNEWRESIENEKLAKEFDELFAGQSPPDLRTLSETLRGFRQELQEVQQRKARKYSVQLEAVEAELNEQIQLAEKQKEFLETHRKIAGGTFKREGDTIPKMAKLYTAVMVYFKETAALFQSKAGIIRSGAFGKRADFTGRAVITPNTYGRLDTIEVPEIFAKEAGYTDYVTEQNISKYTQMLNEGKITFIAKADATGRMMKPIPVTNIDIARGLCKLRMGDRITRWLMDGDIVIAGREPSLHMGNIMAFYAKIRPGSTIGIPFGVVTPWAADFDGDAAHISIPQTDQAKKEALELMLASRNIIGVRTGSPIIGVIYNALKVWTVITSSNQEFPKHLVVDALLDMMSELPEQNTFWDYRTKEGTIIDRLRERCEVHGVNYRTGRGLFSALLPETFNYPPGNLPSKTGVKILNGILVSGVITDVDISANKAGTIVHQLFRMFEDRDEAYRTAALFIHQAYRLADFMGEFFPLTLSSLDCSLEQCGVESTVFAAKTAKVLDKIKSLGNQPSDPYEREVYEQEISNLNQQLLQENTSLYQKLAQRNAPLTEEELGILEQLEQELLTQKNNLREIRIVHDYGRWLSSVIPVQDRIDRNGEEIASLEQLLSVRKIGNIQLMREDLSEITAQIEQFQIEIVKEEKRLRKLRLEQRDIQDTDIRGKITKLASKIIGLKEQSSLLRISEEGLRKTIAVWELQELRRNPEALEERINQLTEEISSLEKERETEEIRRKLLSLQSELNKIRDTVNTSQDLEEQLFKLQTENETDRRTLRMLEQEKPPAEAEQTYKTASREVEAEIRALGTKISDLKLRQQNVDQGILNQFYLGIKSGTKGSPAEFGEMTGMIGRLAKDVSCGTRCLSGFRVGSKDPAAMGIVTSNFIKGLSIPEKFNAQKVQRKPQTDAATKTPEAGALERELSLTLNKYLTQEGALVSHTFQLLQYIAGEDSFHPNYLYPLYGVSVPFDPKVVAETVNAELGWRKFENGNWYHQHRVGDKIYYVKY